MIKYVELLSEPDPTDKFDLIRKHLDRRNDVIQSIAIFDSILEHGYTEEIHNKMIKEYLANFK